MSTTDLTGFLRKVLGEDGTTVLRDWLFLEEAPAVNVVVQLLHDHDMGSRFAVFRQKKYAIPGETLSPVGGFIDPGESPLLAAKREVLEELGLGSRRTLDMIRSEGGGGAVAKSSRAEAVVSEMIAKHSAPPSLDEFGLLIDRSSSSRTTALLST